MRTEIIPLSFDGVEIYSCVGECVDLGGDRLCKRCSALDRLLAALNQCTLRGWHKDLICGQCRNNIFTKLRSETFS
ncbi:hypothetical protein DJ73_19230 [Halorubrum sp. Ea1]|nr:hypothetical protein DJ73_19230 [Halorubrum sp. Ea1]